MTQESDVVGRIVRQLQESGHEIDSAFLPGFGPQYSVFFLDSRELWLKRAANDTEGVTYFIKGHYLRELPPLFVDSLDAFEGRYQESGVVADIATAAALAAMWLFERCEVHQLPAREIVGANIY